MNFELTVRQQHETKTQPVTTETVCDVFDELTGNEPFTWAAIYNQNGAILEMWEGDALPANRDLIQAIENYK